jgi:hypothetical protein
MANINVKDLTDYNITGLNLFDDLESFMVELNDDREQIIGGHALCRYCTNFSYAQY